MTIYHPETAEKIFGLIKDNKKVAVHTDAVTFIRMTFDHMEVNTPSFNSVLMNNELTKRNVVSVKYGGGLARGLAEDKTFNVYRAADETTLYVKKMFEAGFAPVGGSKSKMGRIVLADGTVTPLVDLSSSPEEVSLDVSKKLSLSHKVAIVVDAVFVVPSRSAYRAFDNETHCRF